MNRSPTGLGLLGAGVLAVSYGFWRWAGGRRASVKVVELSQPATFTPTPATVTPTPAAELPDGPERPAVAAPSPARVARNLGPRRPSVFPAPAQAHRPSVPGAKLPPRRPDPV